MNPRSARLAQPPLPRGPPGVRECTHMCKLGCASPILPRMPGEDDRCLFPPGRDVDEVT